jgi:hypothetical protein
MGRGDSAGSPRGLGAGSGPAKEEPRQQRYDNFFEEFRDAEVRVVLYNEKVLSGRIVESRRYWLKLTTDGGTYYYINKAWVVYVQPLRVRKDGEVQTGRR